MTQPAVTIPPAFARHAATVFGATGERWLAALPDLVAALAAQWGLAIGEPFDLSYGYVVAARRAGGEPVVLKVVVEVGEDAGEFARGVHALREYDGRGACRVLAADLGRGAALFERVLPGAQLAALAARDDDAATRAGAAVMRRLWRPADAAHTKPIAEWFANAFRIHEQAYDGPGPLPADVFARGLAIARELLETAPADVLLHGDLHHHNILSGDREPWLAIDPKGMRGDPGYDAGPFLHNPLPGGFDAPLLRRRLDILAAALDYDRDRLRDWGVAHGVLSACWTTQHGTTGWEPAITTAESLLSL